MEEFIVTMSGAQLASSWGNWRWQLLTQKLLSYSNAKLPRLPTAEELEAATHFTVTLP